MSSVRKGQRRKSSIDYNHAFNKLNDDIIRFMLKDFGNKNVIKDPIIYARHKVKLSEEDQMLFDNICKMMGASMEVSYNETSKVRLLKEKYDDTYGVPEYNKDTPDDHNNGNISLADIYNSYKSWRGGFIKYNSKKEIEKVDKHFIELFGDDMGKTISDFCLF